MREKSNVDVLKEAGGEIRAVISLHADCCHDAVRQFLACANLLQKQVVSGDLDKTSALCLAVESAITQYLLSYKETGNFWEQHFTGGAVKGGVN